MTTRSGKELNGLNELIAWYKRTADGLPTVLTRGVSVGAYTSQVTTASGYGRKGGSFGPSTVPSTHAVTDSAGAIEDAPPPLPTRPTSRRSSAAPTATPASPTWAASRTRWSAQPARVRFLFLSNCECASASG